MRFLITFETSVSRVSHHKHRISISAPDFFADFLRDILARRSKGTGLKISLIPAKKGLHFVATFDTITINVMLMKAALHI